MGNLQKRRKCC